jgi:hypothetical protein
MKSPVAQGSVSSSISLWPRPEMTKCTVSWWCRCMSELSPPGWSAGRSRTWWSAAPGDRQHGRVVHLVGRQRSSSSACTTTGRAAPAAPCRDRAEESAMVKRDPDGPSDRLRPSAVDREHGPVDVAASSEARNATAAAISAGPRGRPAGMCARSCASSSSKPRCRRAARLVRICVRRSVGGAGSHAVDGDARGRELAGEQLGRGRDRERSTTDAARSGCGWRTAVEVTNTTRPKPRFGHARQREPGQPQRPEQQQLERLPPPLVVEVEDPAGRRDRRR